MKTFYQSNFHTIFLFKIKCLSWLHCKLTYIYFRSSWFFRKQKFAKGHKVRVNFGPLRNGCHTVMNKRWVSVAGLLCPCVPVLPFIWPFIFPCKTKFCNKSKIYIFYPNIIFFLLYFKTNRKIYLFWQKYFFIWD